MGTSKVVVVEVGFQNAVKVSFSDDDYLIQAFPADAPDQSFDVGILSPCARRSGHFRDPEVHHALGELRPVEAIAITQQTYPASSQTGRR
jgi:hypothetical protein